MFVTKPNAKIIQIDLPYFREIRDFRDGFWVSNTLTFRSVIFGKDRLVTSRALNQGLLRYCFCSGTLHCILSILIPALHNLHLIGIMPYCCAWGCNNGEGSGRSFFRFPKDREKRKEWVARVRAKRDAWPGPTTTTVLCSDHFVSADYETDPELLKSLGFKKQPRLKKDAVPSVFHPGSNKQKRKRASVEEEGNYCDYYIMSWTADPESMECKQTPAMWRVIYSLTIS